MKNYFAVLAGLQFSTIGVGASSEIDRWLGDESWNAIQNEPLAHLDTPQHQHEPTTSQRHKSGFRIPDMRKTGKGLRKKVKKFFNCRQPVGTKHEELKMDMLNTQPAKPAQVKTVTTKRAEKREKVLREVAERQNKNFYEARGVRTTSLADFQKQIRSEPQRSIEAAPRVVRVHLGTVRRPCSAKLMRVGTVVRRRNEQ